jgi:hypothetical protein
MKCKMLIKMDSEVFVAAQPSLAGFDRFST